ncbi:MAG: hypothetical protein H6631_00605 [Anaerolineaceae bacterium]|nr:hypothetical protein [Anaerolineaceae bacterium]MCB9100294.1 hypothetical protein [Anaerolineales bacterium]
MKKRHDRSEDKQKKQAKPKQTITTTRASDNNGITEPYQPIDLVRRESLQTQATRLSDPRLQNMQRQALAANIGRRQGNQYLQRTVGFIQQNQVNLADAPYVRRKSDNIQRDEAPPAAAIKADQGQIQELQEDKTLLGVRIPISPDLLAMFDEDAVKAKPDLGKDKKKYEYKKIKGEAFVKGAGDKADIDPNDVKQGALGDCYLLAAMAAVARANPESIRKLIKDNGDGTYDVTLHVYKHWFSLSRSPVTVKVRPTFPTASGETPAYAGTGDMGKDGPELWAMLIEKAYAQYEGGYNEIGEGGQPGQAMEMLTGLDETKIKTENVTETQIINVINTALKQKWPITTYTRDFGKKKDKEARKLKVVGNHAYTPMAVNTTTKTIDLQNPWGTQHVIGLSISDFKRFYHSIQIVR